MSSIKVFATVGILFIAIISWTLPAGLFMWLIGNHPRIAFASVGVFALYFFNLKTFADCCGRKYEEI